MASKKKYYAVYGSDGLGVVVTWKQAQVGMKFLEYSSCKKTKTFWKAKKVALENYNLRSGDDFKGPIPYNFVLREEHIEMIRAMKLEPEDQIDVICENKKVSFVKKE
jgi:hypothetical protein